MMYAKLFTSIYQGTLRGNSHGLLVFTNLLAHCDKVGTVDMHPRAIAEEVGLTVEQVRAALDELESPDDESRSPEQDGRRIVRLDQHRAWGWTVVNYAKYRAIRDEDDRREQNRLSQERWRNKHKPQSAAVSQSKPQSAHTEAEADIENTPPLPLGVAPPKGRATRKCPESFAVTDAMLDWLALNAAGVAWQTEHAKFMDHTFKTAITDWAGAWRNWMRKAQDFNASKAGKAETPFQRSRRENVSAFTGGLAARKVAAQPGEKSNDRIVPCLD